MENTYIFLISQLLLCFYQVHGQQRECPIDFMNHEESCYHIFATPELSWWDAMSFCAIYGHNGEGTLATIESESEQLFLEVQLKAKFPGIDKDYWLGANDLVNDGTWVWVKRDEYITYNRWAPGQPSSGTAENCLALYNGVQFQWNDAPCQLPEGFICEVPIESRPDEIVG